MSKLSASLTGVSIVLFLLVPGAAGRAAEHAPTADAAGIYHAYCSVCHGEHGDGRSRAAGSMSPPPRDFTSPQAALDLDRERMLEAVRHGRPGTAMQGWSSQLSDAQIVALVDYIRLRFMRATITAGEARGPRLYAANCSVCHGDTGQGAVWTRNSLRPPPRDFTASSPTELTRERMMQSVTYGRPDTAMPGFGTRLARADIEAVVDYVRAAFMGTAPAGAAAGAREQGAPAAPPLPAPPAVGGIAADMSLPFPAGLSGDAVRGQALYVANCVACHGLAGDGHGPRAYFILPKPRDFTHAASRASLNRPALFAAIAMGTNGTEMPAWSKVLDDQSIADIGEYVYRRFIRGGDGSRGAPGKP